jgi:hypothetical protein
MLESMFTIVSWLLHNHPFWIIVSVVMVLLVIAFEEWRKHANIEIGHVYGREITFPEFLIGMVFALGVLLLPAAFVYNAITSYQMISTDRYMALQYEQDYGFCKYHTENITISKVWRGVTAATTTYHIETATGDTWVVNPETWTQFTVEQSYQIGIVSCSNGATTSQPTIEKVEPLRSEK